MKVLYTADALADLEGIVSYLAIHFPSSISPFEERLEKVVSHIATWPYSAQTVTGRSKIRAIPLKRYPYRVFYTVSEDVVAILHIHHTSRQDPWEI